MCIWNFLCKKTFNHRFRFRVFRVSFGNLCLQWLLLFNKFIGMKLSIISLIILLIPLKFLVISSLLFLVLLIGIFSLISPSPPPSSQRICFWFYCYSLTVFMLSVFIGFCSDLSNRFLVTLRKESDSSYQSDTLQGRGGNTFPNMLAVWLLDHYGNIKERVLLPGPPDMGHPQLPNGKQRRKRHCRVNIKRLPRTSNNVV